MSIRINSTSLTTDEQKSLVSLLQRVHKPYLADGKGNQLVIPEPLYQLLINVLQEIKQGNSVVLVPEQEAFTTQAAANYLGISRQYLVNLLESERIPYHKVGSHRRVFYKDLVEFQEKRDKERKSALDDYFTNVDQFDLYE